MTDLTAPWACHMLAVVLAAYILARIWRRRWPAVVLACTFGVILAWTLQTVEVNLWKRFGIYWGFVASVARPPEVTLTPSDYLRAMFFCWITPIAIAWLTVMWRARKAKPDGADE